MNKKFIAIFTLFCLSFSIFVFCETIVLKSGRTVEGKILEKTDKYIKVDIEGIPITYYLDDIESINGAKEVSSSVNKNNFAGIPEKTSNVKNEYTPESVTHEIFSILPSGNEAYLILLNKGMVCLHQGNYDQAIAEFNKAIELNSRLPHAYNNRGIAYWRKGNYDQALADFTKSIEISPNNATSYVGRGSVYGDKGNYDQAISDFNKAIDLDPNIADTYYNRGSIYHDKGDYTKAISDYSKAIEIKPIWPQLYHNRAIAYYYTQEYEKAWADVRKAKELGHKINPELVSRLQEASGREK